MAKNVIRRAYQETNKIFKCIFRMETDTYEYKDKDKKIKSSQTTQEVCKCRVSICRGCIIHEM